jgi:hypothetical protein
MLSDSSQLLTQRFQLLRPLRHAPNLRHSPQHDRYLPHALHLARLTGPGLGDVQVAASGWFRALGLGHSVVQRDHQPAHRCLVATELAAETLKRRNEMDIDSGIEASQKKKTDIIYQSLTRMGWERVCPASFKAFNSTGLEFIWPLGIFGAFAYSIVRL